MQEPGFLQPRGVLLIKWCLQGLPAIPSCAATRAEGTSSPARPAPEQGASPRGATCLPAAPRSASLPDRGGCRQLSALAGKRRLTIIPGLWPPCRAVQEDLGVRPSRHPSPRRLSPRLGWCSFALTNWEVGVILTSLAGWAASSCAGDSLLRYGGSFAMPCEGGKVNLELAFLMPVVPCPGTEPSVRPAPSPEGSRALWSSAERAGWLSQHQTIIE